MKTLLKCIKRLLPMCGVVIVAVITLPERHPSTAPQQRAPEKVMEEGKKYLVVDLPSPCDKVLAEKVSDDVIENWAALPENNGKIFITWSGILNPSINLLYLYRFYYSNNVCNSIDGKMTIEIEWINVKPPSVAPSKPPTKKSFGNPDRFNNI